MTSQAELGEEQQTMLKNKKEVKKISAPPIHRSRAFPKMAHDLSERVKELHCLYEISKLVEKPGISPNEILQGTVNLIPSSLQYPEITCAKIIMGEKEFRTKNYKPTKWKMTRDILLHGKRIGEMRVGYLKKMPEMDEGPFLKEEKNLLSAIAERLGRIIQRMQAEEDLKGSEQRFRAIFDRAQEGFLLIAEDGEILDFNDAAHNDLGYTREEFKQLTIADIDPDEDDAIVRKRMRQISADGNVSFEVRHRTKNGEIRNARVSGKFIELAGRRIFSCIWRDITELKKAQEEAEVAAAARMAKDTVNAMGDGLLLHDMAGKISSVNPAFEKMTGYEKDEVVGKHAADVIKLLVKPEELERTMGAMRTALEERHEASEPVTFITKKGREVPVAVNVSYIKDEEGKPTTVIVAFRDITELKRAQDEVVAAKDYTDNIVECMIDALIVIDPDGTIKTINKATSDLLGYKEEELIGKPVATIFEEEEALFKGTRLEKLIKEGSIRDYIMTYKTKSGEKVPVSFSGSVMRQASCPYRDKPTKDCPEFKKKEMHCEKIIGIVGIVHDIREIMRLMQKEQELVTTEKKRTKELEEAHEELKRTHDMLIQAEKLSAVGQLASGVAHEVENPLAIVIQGVNYLEKKLSLEKESSNVLNMMKGGIRRADNIVRALVDFSRVIKLDIESADINSILEDSLKLIQFRFRLENIKVIKEMKKDLPEALVDKEKMEQVFVNIFINAVQAMPGGGKLFIRSYLMQLNELGNGTGERSRDCLKLGEKALVVEIEDTGVGIPKEQQERVFDPFFTTKGPKQGAGLGLSVTRNIVAMHQGFIEIKSEENKGTKVIISLKTAGREIIPER